VEINPGKRKEKIMLKLTTWVVISIFLLSPFVFVGCDGCLEVVKESQQEQTKQQTKGESQTNQFYENDKLIVKVQTPSGEKVYEGTLVRWWTQGVTIKTDNDRTLLAIAAQVYTVEKQITR
jgi:hypothetical protein